MGGDRAWPEGRQRQIRTDGGCQSIDSKWRTKDGANGEHSIVNIKGLRRISIRNQRLAPPDDRRLDFDTAATQTTRRHHHPVTAIVIVEAIDSSILSPPHSGSAHHNARHPSILRTPGS